ncbi:hypothetical protein E0Z10_g7700 [Xylaria hypoxylon]|uniref:Amidase domain-containing protein n=1 Tax=Xylaria hypoxylon TaxID=37992 RepID=A0A4Z0YD74_9PEZI|nr:hypothetical protein E0Z10_g7700 [Xylaria hypoxylon]
MALSYFNPLVTTTADLRRMLDSQQITSVQIVEQYLEQIDRYEPVLNALASIAPRDSLRRIAESLDDERRGGRVRSPLHGIPIVLKVLCPISPDAFITASDLGMPTCAGAAVFAGAKASKNGAIVQMLVDAGLIILAKGNMTEYAGMKTEEMMPGWSAYGDQTISPYVGPIKRNEKILGHSAPGGSSSGPAVAVAAGFSPLAMGTDRDNRVDRNPLLDILDLSELNIDGKDAIMPIAFWDFKHIGIPTFIEGFSDAPVASLEEIVRFNEQNQNLTMPEPFTKQDQLLRALDIAGTSEEIAQLKRRLRETGKSIINRVLDAENVNCIAAPADSAICIYTAAAGYPHITIPLKKLNYNGRPFGICVMARENDEAVLLRFMAAYESMTAPRSVPSLVF